ncbi:MAG: sigma-70 family RNA polymerase sigma factor [Verrucomicrobiales bacterium]
MPGFPKDADPTAAPQGAGVESGGIDEAVVRALLVTDGAAIRAILVSRYPGAISAPDAEDVLAAAVARLWRNRERFDPGRGSLRAWFFRIADNAARDFLRAGWRKAQSLEITGDGGWIDAIAAPNGHAFPGTEAEDTEPRAEEPNPALHEALQALPEVQRRIVWADALHAGGPAPSDALAEELGIPPGTVRVYRKRALDRLRRALGDT